MKYKLDKEVDIIVIRSHEPNMDRACDSARSLTMHKFGADDCGNLDAVEGWVRSRDHVEVKFVSYTCDISMTGNEHIYIFKAKAVKGNYED